MAAERVRDGFGSKLREARERRGISLRQISIATKISMGALEALERNHVSRLPGGIFSRAFVRSYAIEVGLDPDEAIQEFVAQFPNDSVTGGHHASRSVEDNEAFESQRRIAASLLRLVAVSVPIVGILLYYSSSRPSVGQAPGSVSPETPARVATATGAPVRPSQAGADSFLATISTIRSCWVSAVVDGVTVFQRELRAGERQLLEVRGELVLTAADAGAVTLTLNGQSARALGRDGEAVTTRVDRSNFTEYLTAR